MFLARFALYAACACAVVRAQGGGGGAVVTTLTKYTVANAAVLNALCMDGMSMRGFDSLDSRIVFVHFAFRTQWIAVRVGEIHKVAATVWVSIFAAAIDWTCSICCALCICFEVISIDFFRSM